MTVLLIIVGSLGILVGMLIALLLIRVERNHLTRQERAADEIAEDIARAVDDNVLPRWNP